MRTPHIQRAQSSPSFWWVQDTRWYRGGVHITDDYGNLVRIGWLGFAVYCNGGN